MRSSLITLSLFLLSSQYVTATFGNSHGGRFLGGLLGGLHNGGQVEPCDCDDAAPAPPAHQLPGPPAEPHRPSTPKEPAHAAPKPPAAKPPAPVSPPKTPSSVGIGFSAFEELSCGIGGHVEIVAKSCAAIKKCGTSSASAIAQAKIVLASLKKCNKHVSTCTSTIKGQSKGAVCGKFEAKGAAAASAGIAGAALVDIATIVADIESVLHLCGSVRVSIEAELSKLDRGCTGLISVYGAIVVGFKAHLKAFCSGISFGNFLSGLTAKLGLKVNFCGCLPKTGLDLSIGGLIGAVL